MGLCKKIASIVINFSLFFLIVTFSPGLPPKTTFPFEEFSIVKPKELVGVMEPNKLLENAEKLYVGRLNSPEHLLHRDGAIYTGLGNGDLVKIVGDKIEVVAKFGTPCYKDSPMMCSRPLGLSFDTVSDNLIVMDTSNGIFELNLKTGSKKTLVKSTTEMGTTDPRPPKVFNSVAVAKNGDLYFTDSTSDFEVIKCLTAIFANPAGRLMHVARTTGKITVLLDKLWFANGVALSPNEDFLVVSDLAAARIWKVWLTEGKRGEHEIFAEGLPGTPDNITPDEKGFWVALPITADPKNPFIVHSMAQMPLLRKFVTRLLSLTELAFNTINSFYPNDFSKSMAQGYLSSMFIHSLFPNRSTILRFDWNGNIIAAYHGFDGSFFTHVMELDGHLYLGSFTHDYIAKVVRRAHFIVKPKALTGALEINNHLDNAEHILEGKVPGPEHLLARGNSIYASLHNGNVVRIDGDHVTFIAKFGKPCEYPIEEHICGRPLGLAFDTQGDNLIVTDAYYGLWEVNLKNNAKKQLITPEQVIGVNTPRPAKMFNGVAVAKNGDIFFSSSSSEFGMNDGAFSFFLNPSGRLIHYERKTGKVSVVLDKLWFANGVALSPEEDFVLVAETSASRIQKYYLTGEKKGQTEMFVEGLPGLVDNITPDEDGMWIALVVAADPLNPMLPQSLTRLPLLRKFIVRFLQLVEMPFHFISNMYPNTVTKTIAYRIGSFTAFNFLFPDRTTIVRCDWSGKIIGSLHGFDSSVSSVSHVMELNDYLYIGSPYNDFISKVKFVNKEKIHPTKKQVKREAPESVTQAPTTTKAPTTTTKPTTTTTTTPKPTTAKPADTTTQAPPKTTTKAPPKTTTQAPPQTTSQAPKAATKAPEKETTQAPKAQPTTKTPETATEPPKPAAKPAPIHEKVKDTPPPPTKEPLKVIKKDGPGSI